MPFCKKTGKEFICKRRAWSAFHEGVLTEYRGVHAKVDRTISVESNDDIARRLGMRIAKSGRLVRDANRHHVGCGTLVTNFAQLSSARQR